MPIEKFFVLVYNKGIHDFLRGVIFENGKFRFKARREVYK